MQRAGFRVVQVIGGKRRERFGRSRLIVGLGSIRSCVKRILGAVRHHDVNVLVRGGASWGPGGPSGCVRSSARGGALLLRVAVVQRVKLIEGIVCNASIIANRIAEEPRLRTCVWTKDVPVIGVSHRSDVYRGAGVVSIGPPGAGGGLSAHVGVGSGICGVTKAWAEGGGGVRVQEVGLGGLGEGQWGGGDYFSGRVDREGAEAE